MRVSTTPGRRQAGSATVDVLSAGLGKTRVRGRVQARSNRARNGIMMRAGFSGIILQSLAQLIEKLCMPGSRQKAGVGGTMVVSF